MDNFEFEYKRKKKLKKEPLYILACIFCLIVGSLGGYFYCGRQNSKNRNNEISIYDQIAEAIESDFLDTTDSKEELKERMMYGMVAALGDPHSAYLSVKQAQDLTSMINGSFQGIGITFRAIEAGAIVLDVYKGTPAEKAGLLSGDIITHVQGTSVAGYPSEKIKSVVKGESGSEVTLKIIRDGQVKEVVAIRGSVETSVSYEIRQKGITPIGYLRLTTFGEGTHILVEEALKYFKQNNVENIALDLRGNGGGYLDAAKNILDLFIDENKVIIRVQNKNGKEEVYKTTDREKYHFQQGYILVDSGSASASEVMTGALKEHLGYKLIGTKTYGKGTVQTQYTLSDSSVLKFTRAKWLTPSGICVNGEGLNPDYEVKSVTMDNFYIGPFKGPYRYDQVDNNILYMQTMLKELGYAVDRVDGYYSSATEKAVKAFEKDYGLTVNGIYEKDDVTILLSALAYHVYHEVEDSVYLKVEELIK